MGTRVYVYIAVCHGRSSCVNSCSSDRGHTLRPSLTSSYSAALKVTVLHAHHGSSLLIEAWLYIARCQTHASTYVLHVYSNCSIFCRHFIRSGSSMIN